MDRLNNDVDSKRYIHTERKTETKTESQTEIQTHKERQKDRRKEIFHLTTLSTHFLIYRSMASEYGK